MSKCADGLRQLADWIDAHPEYPDPSVDITNYAQHTKEEAAKVMLALSPCEKDYSGECFYLRRKFGPIRFQFMFTRSEVCVRKVVGSKLVPSVYIPERTEELVEWECSPLLG